MALLYLRYIFPFRFGFKYNLMFAMPAEGWEFSVLEPFKASHVQRKPWKGVEFDVFAFHSQWNFLEVKKLMPTATFISLLRDPVDCFESIFVYMELRKKYKMTINEFAKEIASTGNKLFDYFSVLS